MLSAQRFTAGEFSVAFFGEAQPAQPAVNADGSMDLAFVILLAVLVVGLVAFVVWQRWVYSSAAARRRHDQSQDNRGDVKSAQRVSRGSKMDLPRAEKAIKVGWIAGVIKGLGTFCLVLYSTSVEPVQGVGLEGLIDVAIVLGLSLGIYKRSRTCSVSLVAYQVFVVFLYWSAGRTPNLGLLAPLVLCLLYGMRGTFAYHRLMGQQQSTSLDGLPSVIEAASPGSVPPMPSANPSEGVPPIGEVPSPFTSNDITPPSEATSGEAFFILRNGEPEGPYSLEELRSLLNDGDITRETFYCEEGYEEWVRLEKLADQLQRPVRPAAPPLAPAPELPSRSHNPEVSPLPSDRPSAEEQRTNLLPPPRPAAPPFLPTGKITMQKKKLVVAFGALAFLACGLLPPWMFVVNNEGLHLQEDAGYALLFTPPAVPRRLSYVYSSKVDLSRLGIEWACVCALSAVTWFLMSESPPNTRQPRT
jgi:hypothetical protein